MIIYLDQNKWIELARTYYGKDKSKEKQQVLTKIRLAIKEEKIILPLSAIHYMETARISNANKRARLGKVMWLFSRGYTLTSYRNIVINECETALAKIFTGIKITKLNLVGFGKEHAFGEMFKINMPPAIKNLIEEYSLTGESLSGVDQPKFTCTKYRKRFADHLRKIPTIRRDLPPDKWDDCIYAICLTDISEPLTSVLQRSNIGLKEKDRIEANTVRVMAESMPSRIMDIHLHRQMLKNPSLEPKETDLEDWAGLGVAAQYCDVVICEKHFANLVKRDGFQTKAIVDSNISLLNDIITE